MSARDVMVRVAKAAPLWGPLAGLMYYGRALSRYPTLVYELASCSPPREYDLINRPAILLAKVWPTAALAPQHYGYSNDAHPPASWNPTGFVALGLLFYALSGLVLGFVMRLVLLYWERLRRPRGSRL
jgi:hypothetical protein